MAAYVRPALPRQVFRDAGGQEFEYGDRWGFGGPPEETYSHDSHPERFAPLYDVADALVEHLTAGYDVTVSNERGDRVERRPVETVRVVHLQPASLVGAPLTLLYTTYPGVLVLAGLLTQEHYPVCGCDACDESLEDAVTGLERLVLGVAEGRFREWARGYATTWAGSALRTDDGGRSSAEWRADLPRPARRAIRRRLRLLPDGCWQSWPRS